MISVYSDGSSTGRSDGPGGYGYVIVRKHQDPKDDEYIAWSYGGSPKTTNNLMEIEGAIQGLTALIELGLAETSETCELVSDSQYTLGLASGSFSPSKNIERATCLKRLADVSGVRFRWVKGHKGEIYNEICDSLAKHGKIENTIR